MFFNFFTYMVQVPIFTYYCVFTVKWRLIRYLGYIEVVVVFFFDPKNPLNCSIKNLNILLVSRQLPMLWFLFLYIYPILKNILLSLILSYYDLMLSIYCLLVFFGFLSGYFYTLKHTASMITSSHSFLYKKFLLWSHD